MRVCQFRHDGNYNSAAGRSPPDQEEQLNHSIVEMESLQMRETVAG
jgi:hypothetical protein